MDSWEGEWYTTKNFTTVVCTTKQLTLFWHIYDLIDYSSSSGYHSDARRVSEHRKKQVLMPAPKSSSRPGSRRNPYDFTGCIAHAELTELDSNGEVTRIVGVFEHNTACVNSTMKRLPAVPLHPHVYEVALKQLRNGARWNLNIHDVNWASLIRHIM